MLFPAAAAASVCACGQDAVLYPILLAPTCTVYISPRVYVCAERRPPRDSYPIAPDNKTGMCCGSIPATDIFCCSWRTTQTLPCVQLLSLIHKTTTPTDSARKSSVCTALFYFPGYSLSTSSKRPCVRRFSVWAQLRRALDVFLCACIQVRCLLYIYTCGVLAPKSSLHTEEIQNRECYIQTRYGLNGGLTRFAWSMNERSLHCLGSARERASPGKPSSGNRPTTIKLLEFAGVPTNHGSCTEDSGTLLVRAFCVLF